MKKTLFFLFIFISANAQNKRTINLEIAGTLFSKINTEINNISDITLTGNINNEDIIVLRNMVQNGSLEYVDMFDSYIHGEGDEDNVIPEEAFKNCTNLKSIILPQKTLALGYESFCTVLKSPAINVTTLGCFNHVGFSGSSTGRFVRGCPFLILTISPSISSFSSLTARFRTFISLFTIVFYFD